MRTSPGQSRRRPGWPRAFCGADTAEFLRNPEPTRGATVRLPALGQPLAISSAHGDGVSDLVAEALDEFSHIDVLPNKIFVAGGGAILPEVKNSLLSKVWAANLPFSKKPYPAVIESTDIPHVVLENQVAMELSDMVALGLAHLTLDQADQSDTVGDMLRRIVLNMQG